MLRKAPAPLAILLLSLIAAAGTAQAAKASKRGPAPSPNVLLYHLNHKEKLTLKQRDLQGRPPKVLQKRFDRFLRCHHTGRTHAMHPRLMRLLYQMGRHWPGRRLEVVSGYRHPKVAKNPRSPHMKGLACDVRVVGVTNGELRDYLRRAFQKVGVGYYPNSSFVHLDVRKDRSAFWIDYSGPGERAMYSEKPAEDLKTGRADDYRPTKIGEDWLNDTAESGESGATPASAAAPTAPPAPAEAPTPPAGSGPALP